MEDHGGVDIHLQPVEDPVPEEVDAPKGGCDPMGSPCWSKLLAGPVAPWREDPTPEQKKNKPKEPPKVPKSAPFFIPTLPGLIPRYIAPEEENDTQSKVVNLGVLAQKSDFYIHLEEALSTNEYTAPLNLLKSLGPSNIEIELRGLAPEGGGSMEVMISFLKMIGRMVNKKYNFELAQAYLALFLKVMENRRSAWGLEESQCHSGLQKGQEGGPRELQASQPHLHPWKGDAIAHSGVMSKHVEEKKVIGSSQHGFTKEKSCLTNLTAFYDGMTGWVDEGRAVGVVCLDVSKAFDTVSHNIVIGKLRKCGLDEWTVQWVQNWLNGRAQRVE
ncbi:WD repeat-containing protein 36 [Grus japonensis]|uniref:WD repeat-containing protein 36 n=1 Tax=Grus japonensis TaxID=30415 RepID=A0ABC9Y7C0_GRUJA